MAARGNPCEACGANAHTDRICGTCINRFGARLSEVPHLIAQLHISVAKLSRMTSGHEGGTSGGGGPKPLPLNPDAVAIHNAYHTAVVSAATAHGIKATARRSGIGGPVVCAEWLLGELPRLRRMGGADLVHSMADLDRAAEAAWALIDRPPLTWYAGPCPGGKKNGRDDPCGQDLLAEPGAARVRCRRCRRIWPVAERRDALLDAMWNYRARAAWIASVLTPMLERRVTAQSLYLLVHRGHLEPSGQDAAGFPLYRIGDAVRALQAREARRQAQLPRQRRK